MIGRVGRGLLLCCLAAAWSAAAPPRTRIDLPASHPRDLVFPPSTWQPPDAESHRFPLAGGATAFLIEDRVLPLVDIVVVARAGADRDPVGARGLSHWTTTLLRRGGAAARPPDVFDERADALGAILRSQATMLYGAATLRATADVLEDAMALLLDMIETPRFDPERLASAQRNMAEGMTRRTLDPLAVLDREWDWLLYGDDHFSTRALRSDDLEAIDSERLMSFHREHWRPENLTFAVAGDIDAETLRRLVEPRLEVWRARLEAPAASAWPPAGPTAAPRRGLFHVEAQIPQAKVAFGHRAASERPSVEERVRLEVTAEILAGRGAISRLNGRLRSAEGLVYRVDARVDPGDLWPADYRFFFDTLAANTPRALAAALQEIDRVRTTLPHPEELEVVKRELITRQQQAFDTAEEAVGYLVEDWLVARPPAYRRDYRKLVTAVTGEDVRDTARRHLRPDELTVLLVGPWEAARGALTADGVSELEQLLGYRVEALPARDPSTLEPRTAR